MPIFFQKPFKAGNEQLKNIFDVVIGETDSPATSGFQYFSTLESQIL